MQTTTRPAWPELAIGLGLLAVAALVCWQTAIMPVSPIYAKVGPRVFPYITAAALGLLAAALLVQAWRGGWQPEEERAVAIDPFALAFVAGGMFANVLLIVPLGFTVASVVMFTLIAYGFGSRRPLRDAAIALAFALLCYFGFARALGVNIGAGPVEQALTVVLERVLGG